MWRALGLAAGAAVVFAAGSVPASAMDDWAPFLAPDAAFFAVQRVSCDAEAIAPLPGGGALVAADGPLWRVDGPSLRPERIRPGRHVDALTTTADGRVLVASGRRIWHLDPSTTHLTPFADLGAGVQWIDALAALDEGSVAAVGDSWRRDPRLYRVGRDGTVTPTAVTLDNPAQQSVAPLPDGAIAVSRGGRVVQVDADGRRTVLAPTGLYPPLVATGADLLGVTSKDRLAILHPGSSALDVLETGDGSALGTGEGLSPAQSSGALTSALATADDGRSLYVLRGCRVLALAPRSSPRPRIAITQDGYAEFVHGRVAYEAGVAGHVTVEVRPSPGPYSSKPPKVIASGSADTAGGAGTMPFSPHLPPGPYDVIMRLEAAGTVREAQAHIDTRTTLPLARGRAAIYDTLASTGDEGYNYDEDVDGCAQLSLRVVRCRIRLRYGWSSLDSFDASDYAYPFSIDTATQRLDGVRFERRRLHVVVKPELRLRLGRPILVSRRHPTAAVHLRVDRRAEVRVRAQAVLAGSRWHESRRWLRPGRWWTVHVPLDAAAGRVRIHVVLRRRTPEGPVVVNKRREREVDLVP